ncbi:MAG: hypothetical protein ABIF10_06885 [Candidatus Woesearchaeota archaeon]
MSEMTFQGYIKGFRSFGHDIATLVNSAILFVVYFVGIGLTSLASRIVGKRFLVVKQPQVKTYWKDLNLKKCRLEEYYRQF